MRPTHEHLAESGQVHTDHAELAILHAIGDVTVDKRMLVNIGSDMRSRKRGPNNGGGIYDIQAVLPLHNRTRSKQPIITTMKDCA